MPAAAIRLPFLAHEAPLFPDRPTAALRLRAFYPMIMGLIMMRPFACVPLTTGPLRCLRSAPSGMPPVPLPTP